jgi:nitronate monooxygenase
MSQHPLPTIIQGGMGVGVSSWRLARAVSRTGQLGVISGTAMDVVLSRRLQLGDPGGHMQRALARFPIPGVAERILERYLVPGGKPEDRAFRSKPVPAVEPTRHLEELLVAGCFVEVFLAREGHDGQVGVNYLEKIQLPTLPSLYGAMLAGVGWVLMGAGIPRTIPGILDRLAQGQPVELKLDVKGAERDDAFFTRFDPQRLWGGSAPALDRPKFLAIVSSATLAAMLLKKSTGRVDGFVIEGSTAGGHNAPPRGKMQLSAQGEPIYGERDVPDLEALGALGRPIWLAGSYAEPERVAEALRQGATGVQVGTAFAYCEESGLAPDLKRRVLEASRRGEIAVFTDPVASPTGFPFKVVQLEGTIADDSVYAARRRVCDLSFLRHAYKQADGSLGWRCPAEPLTDYLRKGGAESDTHGRKCICNALAATIGIGQIRSGEREKPIVTSGDDAANVARFLADGAESYKARDVIAYLLRDVE